jgi:hypothetical protein
LLGSANPVSESSKPNEGFERAAVVGPDREKLATEYARVTDTGIPTFLESGGQRLRGRSLQQVTAAEVAAFGSPRAAVCGSCKFFDLENGRREIVRQKFGEKLVKDYEWKLKHLGAEPDAIGLCGASGGEIATTFVSKACDQYRVR